MQQQQQQQQQYQKNNNQIELDKMMRFLKTL
jgi:hypothetical protein